MATELKPCPFCGGYAHIDNAYSYYSDIVVYCEGCDSVFSLDDCNASAEEIANAWNKRTSVKVETSFYDKEETYPDCTVQVLTNTANGETSVGWWRNGL